MFSVQLQVPVALLLLSIVLAYIYVEKQSFTAIEMANNGLIFVTNAAKVHNVCQKASKFVKKVLYITIKGNHEGLQPVLSKQIVNVYSRATNLCNSLDVRLLLKASDMVKSINTNNTIDLILYENDLEKEAEKLSLTVANKKGDSQMQSIESLESQQISQVEPIKTYEYVALGGTFDRLHNGHKILLSQAVLRATKHVTVGVTDVNMIQSKKLWELIEPLEKRIEAVRNFLTDINPDLEYDVLPLQDLYGPTKDDPKFQMIVVSEETVRGANKINERRKENGLQELEMYVIGLAEDFDKKSDEEEIKISSSNQRMRLLGTLLKPPVPNPSIPDWPYVIGLAGGIASGKSSIANKLQAKGAVIVNCDFIAHDLYKPGLPLNTTIAETFGRQVITEDGEVDRKMLGSIVFGDMEKLEKLNQVLWPAIIDEAKNRIKALGEQGHKVVVMEAAVMVRARWYTQCHQLWTVIIPPEEAIKRIQKRNNLTEEEARQRINSQPTNLEQVEPANIVFSPYWSYEYTQSQVDKAWDLLQNYLRTRKASNL